MYCAAVPVSTQYFLGLYATITYVMILFIFVFSPGFLLGGPGHIMPWCQVISTWVTIIPGAIAFGSLKKSAAVA